MQLQRFITKEGLPARSGTDTVNFQDVSSVGRATRGLGIAITNAFQDQANVTNVQDARRVKAEEDLAVSRATTRFKSDTEQIITNRRKAYSESDSMDTVMSKFQPDVVGELRARIESEPYEDQSPTVRARFMADAYGHIDSLIGSLGNMSSEMIVQASEKRIGEAKTTHTEMAVNAPDAASLEQSVASFSTEVYKAVPDALSQGKAEERVMKFHEDVSRDWFARKAASDPESMYRALHSSEPNDRRLLAQVDGKAIAAFIKNYGEQTANDFKGQSASRLQTTFPLVVRGSIIRRDLEYMAELFTTEDFNKIQSQVDKNEQRVNESLRATKDKNDDDLKKKQAAVENQFWDRYFSNPGLVNGSLSLQQDRDLKILEPSRYEKVRETLAQARDVGGLGDEATMNLWKAKLFHDSNALKPDEIMNMNKLNYKQRQELFAAKRTQDAFEKEGGSNAKHFSNDPNYKFYSGAIQEQLGIIKLSPFTNASSIQVLSQAEVSYREEFKRMVDTHGSVSMEEAKALMSNVVAIARQNIGIKATATGEMPRYQDSMRLQAAKETGQIDDKEFVREYEKLKAWRAIQGINPDGTPMDDAAGDRPKRAFKRHGKE